MNGKIILKGLTLMIFTWMLTSCNQSLKEGITVPDGKHPISQFWETESADTAGNIVTLEKSNARLSSKFLLHNFVLSMRLKTTAGAEGFIVFHTPAGGKNITEGYKVIINNSDYRNGSQQKTGSLSWIRNNYIRTASDDNWFEIQVSVRANHIGVMVNKKMVSEYVEPEKPLRIQGFEKMILSSGYLVLQKSNNTGIIQIDQISVEPLSPELAREIPDPLTIDATGEALTLLNQQGFPLIDFHGHLKGGLTVDQVCEHGRKYGYNYGLAPNCGLNFPVTNDSTLIAHFNNLASEPVFKAMQCEGREWVTLFSPASIRKFDYIFTDAMTWTDHKGRRMRLWIPEETFVEDEQQFMEMLVGKIEAILYHEPVDIHVNPTYLPAIIAADYDRLWTPERMDRVIKSLTDNDVALEINARFRIPSLAFIKRAKAAGVKFTFGTNNADNTDLNRLEYCIMVIKEAGLTPNDVFLPRPAGDKKVMKMGLPVKITG